MNSDSPAKGLGDEGLNIVEVLLRLRSIARSGWMMRGVPPSMAENVAEHSYLSAAIAYLLASKLKSLGVKVEPEKAAVIAVFHDVTEAFTGDIPSAYPEVRVLKRKVEENAINLVDGNVRSLIAEFLEERSVEALVAKASDRLATMLVGAYYSERGFDVCDIILNTYTDAATLLTSLVGAEAEKIIRWLAAELGTHIDRCRQMS